MTTGELAEREVDGPTADRRRNTRARVLWDFGSLAVDGNPAKLNEGQCPVGKDELEWSIIGYGSSIVNTV